jgi:hypothetical protein
MDRRSCRVLPRTKEFQVKRFVGFRLYCPRVPLPLMDSRDTSMQREQHSTIVLLLRHLPETIAVDLRLRSLYAG